MRSKAYQVVTMMRKTRVMTWAMAYRFSWRRIDHLRGRELSQGNLLQGVKKEKDGDGLSFSFAFTLGIELSLLVIDFFTL